MNRSLSLSIVLGIILASVSIFAGVSVYRDAQAERRRAVRHNPPPPPPRENLYLQPVAFSEPETDATNIVRDVDFQFLDGFEPGEILVADLKVGNGTPRQILPPTPEEKVKHVTVSGRAALSVRTRISESELATGIVVTMRSSSGKWRSAFGMYFPAF